MEKNRDPAGSLPPYVRVYSRRTTVPSIKAALREKYRLEIPLLSSESTLSGRIHFRYQSRGLRVAQARTKHTSNSPSLPTPTTQCKFGNRILRNFAGRGGIKFRRDTLSIHARPSFPTDPVLFRLSRLAYPTFHLSGHISRNRKGWTREEESHELTANPQKISKIGF